MNLLEGYHPQTSEAIARLIDDRAPSEAVGLILRRSGDPEVVIELSNISLEPTNSYLVSLDELITESLKATDAFDDDELEVILWHSHPSGLVGPSRGDLVEKIPGLTYLVVTRVDGDLIWTWF